jgi:MoxR-like ATPase
VAHYFGLDRDERFFRLDVKSNTGHEELTYRFDAVAYLHAANDPRRSSAPITKGEFIEQGVLWRAFEADGPCVVLIDEIDKAPRGFPNDLLRVLDEHSFHCKERNRDIGRGERPPPFILVTSNNERRLPEAFLRRCIFHHIVLGETLVQKAVTAHCGHPDFPDLAEPVRTAAIRRFFGLRARDLGKKPSLGELLVWLTILAAKGFDDPGHLETCPLGALPALPALINEQDDLERLRV